PFALDIANPVKRVLQLSYNLGNSLAQQSTYISKIRQEAINNDANIRLVNSIGSIKQDLSEINRIKESIENIVKSGTSYTDQIKGIYELSGEYREILGKVKNKFIEISNINPSSESIESLGVEINVYSDLGKVFDNYI